MSTTANIVVFDFEFDLRPFWSWSLGATYFTFVSGDPTPCVNMATVEALQAQLREAQEALAQARRNLSLQSESLSDVPGDLGAEASNPTVDIAGGSRPAPEMSPRSLRLDRFQRVCQAARRSAANFSVPRGGAQASQMGQAAARSPGGGVFLPAQLTQPHENHANLCFVYCRRIRRIIRPRLTP